MSKTITIEVDEETYKFLETRADEEDTLEILASEYLEQGINIEQTLRQH